jgi:hypothetical protein
MNKKIAKRINAEALKDIEISKPKTVDIVKQIKAVGSDTVRMIVFENEKIVDIFESTVDGFITAGGNVAVAFGNFLKKWTGYSYEVRPVDIEKRPAAPDYTNENIRDTFAWVAEYLDNLRKQINELKLKQIETTNIISRISHKVHNPEKIIRICARAGEPNPFTQDVEVEQCEASGS